MKKPLQNLLLTLTLFTLGCGTNRSEYEAPKYATLLAEQNYEIRDYQPALMALTRTSSDDTGFRRIFKFISGENSSKESISMTVPVRVSTIADNSWMAFFMPSKYDPSSIPQPSDAEVTITEFPGGLFAAVKFTGTSGPEKVTAQRELLLNWVKQNGYSATSDWYLDRYDPPWTLWFNRTNEIVVKLEGGQDRN